MADFTTFSSTYPFEFDQAPIIVVKLSSLIFHELVDNQILCQPHFGLNSYKIAFYVNCEAYYEELSEYKIRQRIAILNPQSNFKKIKLLTRRIRRMLDSAKVEINFKLLSPSLISIEMKEGSFKYKFHCEQKSELYDQHYVKHLLLQIRELQLREQKLLQLLTSKPENGFNADEFISTPIEEDTDDYDTDLLTDNLFGYAFSEYGRRLVSMAFLKHDYFKYRKTIDPSADTSSSLPTKIARIIDILPLEARKLSFTLKRKQNELAEIDEKIERKRLELDVLTDDSSPISHEQSSNDINDQTNISGIICVYDALKTCLTHAGGPPTVQLLLR
ncbi:unnamed protein product [Didymodactylos carnosus]|uniref:XLF-like N-terminal domain-containing protein n=1 Tax=Didymodactylos carnosus TaxID=1234261 RepID=A0A8S2DGK6_9BILA|nr:unnamed protein product [Didymodactylos carnosus]CAF3680838.1 unnamed protein product [Didymodactylos carnosus]